MMVRKRCPVRSRGYRQDDVEAMYQLDLECFSGAFQFGREMMRQAAEALAAIVVVVEDDAGAMVGFLIVHLEGKESHAYAYIITVDVAERARRLGVGATMLRKAEEQALGAGLDRMGLHVAIDNAGAISFYEHQGYELTGVARGFYQEARQDALVYVKEL